MTTLLLKLPFTATHQILIAGELEPVHGHDFGCEVAVQVDDDRDASELLPLLSEALRPLQHSHLERVEATEGGHPSAERIARYLFRDLAERMRAIPGTAITSCTVHESPGCSATYRE